MRLRRHWFTDRPRNVSRRDYNRYQWRLFGAISTGMMALMMAIAAGFGLTLQTSRQLAGVEAMTVAAAMDYDGDRLPARKIEGFLVTDQPISMPDEASLQVLKGELQVVLEGDLSSDEVQRETLLEWRMTASPVYLTDGNQRLPLAFDLAALPLETDTQAKTDFTYGGTGRTSRPVEVIYGDQIFPLDRQTWDAVDVLRTEVTRRFLPQGQTVVIVAGLESQPAGNQLVDPLGDRLRIELGSEAEIRRSGQHMRWVFGILWIPLAIASYSLAKSAQAMYLDFIFKSHGA